MTKQSHLRLVHDEDDFSAYIFLGYLDPQPEGAPEKAFTFQTIPEAANAVGEAQIIQGTFGAKRAELELWNSRGHGIYVSVNPTDLKGRKQSNVTGSRAVFQDDDQGVGWLVPSIKPSLEVETSPGKWHRWAFIADEVTLDEWDALQAAMIHRFGSDPNAKGRQAVLRMPGFWNVKKKYDAPHMVTMRRPWSNAERRYTRAELFEALQPRAVTPAGPAEPLEPTASDRTPLCALDLEHNVKRAQEYLDGRPVIHVGLGVNNALFPHAAMLKDFGISAERGWEMLQKWLDECGCNDRPKSLATFERAYAGGNRPGCKTPEADLEGFEVIDPTLPGQSPGAGKEVAAPGQPPARVTKHIEWPAKDDKGKPHANSMSNVVKLLQHLHVELRSNRFTGLAEVKGEHGFEELNDSKLNLLWAQAQQKGLPTKFDAFARLISVVADAKPVHPVRAYLEGLKWDGVARLDTWLSAYLGAVDTPLVQAFGRATLQGAVRRVLFPGCKHDLLLVLEGPQGTFKSTAVKVLGGEWYGDGLKLGVEAKETIEQTRGLWVCEIPELSGMGNREVEAIKHALSRGTDRARMAFGRLTSAVPRQWVAIATTNSDRYLRDTTGNRRFMPVKVGKIDLERLAADRDQLWAEAYWRVDMGAQSSIPEELWEAAAVAQEERRTIDPIEERLTELLDGFENTIVLKEDCWLAIDSRFAIARHQRSENSMADTMKKLGWKASRQRVPGRMQRRPVYEQLVPGLKPEWRYYFDGAFLTADELERAKAAAAAKPD